MYIRLQGDETLVVVSSTYAPQGAPVRVPYGLRILMTLAFYHDDKTPWTAAELQAFVAWRFGMDGDYDLTTDPAILTDTGFVVSGNTLSFVAATGTPRALDLLNNKESAKIYAQLDGYKAGDTLPSFRVQFSALLMASVLADGAVAPEENPQLYATMTQVLALLRAGFEVQFSVNGTGSWHSVQGIDDRYYNFRYPEGEWSAAIAMVAGPSGKSSYQTWLDNGHTGSEAVFLASLIGPVGPSPIYQYSVDGAISWHSTFAAGDKYDRVSGDSGSTWSPARRIAADAPQYQYSANGSTGWGAYVTGYAYERISVDGGTTWSGAIRIKGIDAPALQTQYSVDGTTGWSSVASTNTVYQRYSADGGSTWSSAVNTGGIAGQNAPAVQYQFSVDGSTSWHGTFAAGDKYLKFSVDGGNTYDAAIKFVGDPGADGGGITAAQAQLIAMIYG